MSSDQDGIYELSELPADDYSISLALPDNLSAPEYKVRKEMLPTIPLIERDFQVSWNGTIDGDMHDPYGHPAHVWLLLQDPDGPANQFTAFRDTEKNGSFHIGSLPPGRYVLMINPYGPTDDSPYPPAYYTTALRSKDAHVFEIGEGQHIKSVSGLVARLPQRKVHVRVRWPDGQPVDGAWISVAYEHTRGFTSLGTIPHVAIADHNGEVAFYVFGKSLIRIYAEQIVDDPKTHWFSARDSVPAEFEADKVPDQLNLVLSRPDLFRAIR